MNFERISLGFDLRLDPVEQSGIPGQWNQLLSPEVQSPLCADPSVWLQAEGTRSLGQGALLDFSNPLHLAKRLDLLVAAYQQRDIPTAGLLPVCITTFQANLVPLVARYGPGYFEDQAYEDDLLSEGWQFMGFDVVDLDGLISGLKGCGYAEPTWSQLRDHFGASLNGLGLFSELSMASHFAEVRGLQIRSHAPFVVVGILIRASLGG